MAKRRKKTMAKWRASHTPGQMNKTEGRFARRLDELHAAGEIVGYDFEPIKLRLGVDWKTTYTVDFMVLRPTGLIELIDVKGSGPVEDVAKVKIKTAARLFPQFAFYFCQEIRGRTGQFDWNRF